MDCVVCPFLLPPFLPLILCFFLYEYCGATVVVDVKPTTAEHIYLFLYDGTEY